MPLEPGASRKVVSHNIEEMMASGHPQKQAVAASLENARRTGKGKKAKSVKKSSVSDDEMGGEMADNVEKSGSGSSAPRGKSPESVQTHSMENQLPPKGSKKTERGRRSPRSKRQPSLIKKDHGVQGCITQPAAVQGTFKLGVEGQGSIASAYHQQMQSGLKIEKPHGEKKPGKVKTSKDEGKRV